MVIFIYFQYSVYAHKYTTEVNKIQKQDPV